MLPGFCCPTGTSLIIILLAPGLFLGLFSYNIVVKSRL
jgi:hypothetical protein